MPEVPFNPVELSKQARVLYEQGLEMLEKCFESYTDEQAMRRPAPNEWSALEVVAHLIQGERFNANYLTSLIDGYEPTTDGFGDNVTASVEAVVKANPSIKEMMDALRRISEEYLIYISIIPAEFAANKGSYYRFGSAVLQPNFHFDAHAEQIKNALTAAK
jgi:hypothetical protein